MRKESGDEETLVLQVDRCERWRQCVGCVGMLDGDFVDPWGTARRTGRVDHNIELAECVSELTFHLKARKVNSSPLAPRWSHLGRALAGD